MPGAIVDIFARDLPEAAPYLTGILSSTDHVRTTRTLHDDFTFWKRVTPDGPRVLATPDSADITALPSAENTLFTYDHTGRPTHQYAPEFVVLAKSPNGDYDLLLPEGSPLVRS